jgi:hypothetical protein
MERTFKKIIGYTLYTLLCSVIFYYIATPKIIERRAIDLGLMKYSADKDRMIAKDSLQLSGGDVYYLQYGNMNDY